MRFYVSASSSARAQEKLRRWVRENCFQLIELEWCVDSAQVEWEKPDDETAAALISQARDSGDIVYGEFHVWGHDAPDA